MRTIDEVLRGLKNYRSEGQFRLSASNAVEAALSALPGRAMPQVREFIATERAVSVSFVCANNTAEVAVGDVVQAGILLHYSAGPDEGMSVRALYLRLKCLNGLVAEECGAPARILSHPHDSHLGSIEATVGGLWARLPRKLEELRALPRNRAAVPSLLEESARRAGLSRQHTMPRLLRAWAEEESASTEWGALNALTRVATHAQDMPTFEREALSRTAGAFAFRRSHSCSRCTPDLTWRNSGFMTDLRTFVFAGLRPIPRT